MKFGRMPYSRRPVVSAKDIMWLIYLYPLRLAAWVLPLRLFLQLGRITVPLFRFLTMAQSRAVASRLEKISERLPPGSEIREIAGSYLRNSVSRSLEDLVLDKLLKSGLPGCREFKGKEHLDGALAKGRGVILLTVHTFANRLGKRCLALSGYPVMSIRNRYPQAGSMGKLGCRVLQPRYVKFLESVILDEAYIQDPDCSLKILCRLREGGLVNLHLDGLPTRKVRVVSFLGATAEFPVGFLEIVRLTGAAVLPMLCLGNSRNLSITIGKPFEIVPAGSEDEFIDSNYGPMIAYMESSILSNPDQWELWIRI